MSTALEQQTARAAPQKAASKKQLEEMTSLLADVREGLENGTASKQLGAAFRKRSWIQRGIAAQVASGEMIEHCPKSEQPFFEFADFLHQTLLQRMLTTATNRSQGDYRAFLQLLESLWREEYGKKENAGSGVTVVIVERPPRD